MVLKEEVIFDSEKAKEIFYKRESRFYIGSQFNVTNPCTIDLFYKGEIVDVTIFLIKRHSDFDKPVKHDGMRVALGNTENGYVDNICIEQPGHYVFASKKLFDNPFKNTRVRLVKFEASNE